MGRMRGPRERESAGSARTRDSRSTTRTRDSRGPGGRESVTTEEAEAMAAKRWDVVGMRVGRGARTRVWSGSGGSADPGTATTGETGETGVGTGGILKGIAGGSEKVAVVAAAECDRRRVGEGAVSDEEED